MICGVGPGKGLDWEWIYFLSPCNHAVAVKVVLLKFCWMLKERVP